MTTDSIMAQMRTPWAMSPREIVYSYMFLVSVHAQKVLQYLEADAKAAELEGQYLSEDMTSAKAKTMVKTTPQGKESARLKGEIGAIQQMIQALKRAQAFYSDEAHNLL